MRWVCPTCASGVNGPERPRKDDVRRYCLKCSERTGRLVERSAPVLERKRAKAKTASQERQRAKAQAQQNRFLVTTIDAMGTEHVINVKTELRKALTALKYFEGWARGHKPTIDEMDITIRRSKTKTHSSGRAQGILWVVFTFGNPTSYEEALELIYHEAAHLAAPADAGHGVKFRRLLADALQKRWPFITYGSVRRGQCYGADEEVVAQMKEHVKSGGIL